MIYILVAVKDNAVQAFQAVNTVRAKGEALRSFMDAVNDPNNKQLAQHPEDFDLYLVGTFNDEDGELNAIKPELMLRGVDAKKT